MEVEVSLQGNGLQFSAKVSLLQATQIIGFIAKPSDVQSPSNDQPVLISHNGVAIPQQAIDNVFDSPRRAIDTLKAKTNPQKIVALALYLGATSQNGRLFNIQEITSLFSKAGEKTPKNSSRDFNDAVTLGYIYPEDDGTYRLLSTTDTLSSEGFKKIKVKQRSSQGGKSKAGRKTTSEVRDQVEKLPVSTALDSYPQFFDIKNRSDKVLWILEYAKKNNIDGLNRTEIISYSKKIGGGLSTQSFTSANTPNIKGNYIYLKDDLAHITPNGESHLQKEVQNEKQSSQ